MKVTRTDTCAMRIENDDVVILINPTVAVRADAVIITDSAPERFCRNVVADVRPTHNSVDILCAESAYGNVEHCNHGDHNHVLLAPHSVWSCGNVTIYSVKAQNPDTGAIGVIIDDSENTIYYSGATLYNFDVIDDVLDLVEDGVTHAFIPAGGRRGCMNAKDAADFAYEIGAKAATPLYPSSISELAEFDFDDRVDLAIGDSIEID